LGQKDKYLYDTVCGESLRKSAMAWMQDPLHSISLSSRNAKVVAGARQLLVRELLGQPLNIVERNNVFSQYAKVMNDIEEITGKFLWFVLFAKLMGLDHVFQCDVGFPRGS
jgi:hypothetical protein